MQQACTECSSAFDITDEDQSFYRDMDVPPPRRCPDCRFMRRLVERNAYVLYKRKCDLTGKEFISPYHSDHPFPVYHPDEWLTDKWDETDYARDIDFSKPFFEQFKELLNSVPRQGQFICPGTLENSDYVNCAGYLKDCYLVAETDYNEKCYYGNRIFHCLLVVDSSNCVEDELCYECIDCLKSYNLRFSQDCENCSDSFFLKNCIGCRDCIGCINQRQKQYMIFNEQLNKEEYEKRKAEMQLDSRQGIEKTSIQVEDFFLTQPQKAVQNEHNQNSSGNHLYDSKNAVDCLDCKDLEDCKYCVRCFSVKSSMDYTAWGDRSEKMYEAASCGDDSYNLKFCTTCTTGNSDLEYCGHCTASKDCFGCVSMRRKRFCILNKQYSEMDYRELKAKLIEHMKETPYQSPAGSGTGQAGEYGEFFPIDLSSFGFNETIAMEYFPLTKDEVLQRGYTWREVADEKPNVKKIVDADQLPQTIEEVPDAILNWAIRCKDTGRAFRIIKQELDFYRQSNLPVPQLHPDERRSKRIARRATLIFDRTCGKCQKEMKATFAPDRPEIVYCEECYLKEVY